MTVVGAQLGIARGLSDGQSLRRVVGDGQAEAVGLDERTWFAGALRKNHAAVMTPVIVNHPGKLLIKLASAFTSHPERHAGGGGEVAFIRTIDCDAMSGAQNLVGVPVPVG